MICPNCNQRWAPFDEEDFIFTGRAFIALHGYSEGKREQIWGLDQPELCPGCKEELNKTWCFKNPGP